MVVKFVRELFLRVRRFSFNRSDLVSAKRYRYKYLIKEFFSGMMTVINITTRQCGVHMT